MKECHFSFQEIEEGMPFKKTGTRLRISNICSDWNEEMIDELKDNLSRLISPFSTSVDFAIHFYVPKYIPDGIVKIESPKFLRQPKYKIKGNADKHGNLFCSYNFKSVSDDTIRKSDTSWTWEQIYKSLDKERKLKDLKSQGYVVHLTLK